MFFSWSEAWEGRERLGTKVPSSGTERAQIAMTVGSEDLQTVEDIAVEDRL